MSDNPAVNDDYFADLDQVESDVLPSGFDLVGEVIVQLGWAVMPYGVTVEQDKKWFPFDPGKSEEQVAKRKAAREAALKAIDDNGWVNKKGEKASPIACLAFIISKASELTGRMSEWKTDLRFDTILMGVQGYTDITKPSLLRFKEAGVENPFFGKHWVHLGYAKDPTGRTNTSKEGRVFPARVPFVVVVLKDRAAAEAYVTANSLTKSGTVQPAEPAKEFPEGFTKASWKATIPEIKKAIEVGKQSLQEIADDYGIALEWVEKVKSK